MKYAKIVNITCLSDIITEVLMLNFFYLITIVQNGKKSKIEEIKVKTTLKK